MFIEHIKTHEKKLVKRADFPKMTELICQICGNTINKTMEEGDYFGKCFDCDVKHKHIYDKIGMLKKTLTCECDVERFFEKLKSYQVSVMLDYEQNIVLNIGQEFFRCKKISPSGAYLNSKFVFKSCGEKLKGKIMIR